MRTRLERALPVTRDQVAAFRLSRHHLKRRAPRTALLEVAGDMCGAQAQLLTAAYISLWTRLRGLHTQDVEAAIRSRALVRAACMRRTLFLVPAGDLAMFVRGTSGRAEREIRWMRRKGISERVLDRAIDAALDALSTPVTRPEIATRVSRTLGVAATAGRGAGWGNRNKVAAVRVGHLTVPIVYLLELVSARGVVCYGPQRGIEPTFVRAEAWIPRWKDMAAEEAVLALARRYMRSFAPATPEDFAAWTRLTFKEARRAWSSLHGELEPVNVAGWVGDVMKEDVDTLARARLPGRNVRLLPHFDSYVFGHRERNHLVADRHQAKVYRPQGWVAPVVLVDGRIHATWGYERSAGQLGVSVSKLRPFSQEMAAAVRNEAEDLGRFLGDPSVLVTFAG